MSDIHDNEGHSSLGNDTPGLEQQGIQRPGQRGGDLCAVGNFSLTDRHRRWLEGYGLQAEAIRIRSYWSATSTEELKEAGFARSQWCSHSLPTLMIPQYDLSGALTYSLMHSNECRYGADPESEQVPDRIRPYWNRLRLDVPPLPQRELLGDPRETIYWADDAMSADILASHGFVVVDTPGLRGWRTASARADILRLRLQGREVVLVTDSEPASHRIIHLLAWWLTMRGARVSVIAWERGDGCCETPMGVNFYLSAHTLDDFQALIIPYHHWMAKIGWDGQRRCTRCWEGINDKCGNIVTGEMKQAGARDTGSGVPAGDASDSHEALMRRRRRLRAFIGPNILAAHPRPEPAGADR